MKLLLAALALGAPVMTAAAMPAPVAAPASDLDRLVLLLLPEQQLLDVIATAVRKQAKSIPDFARDPAMADFVFARMRPEVDKVMRESLPELRAEIAKIVSTELTPGEIGEVYAFFSSPAGQKLQRHAFKAIGENPNAQPAEQQRIAVEGFMAELAPSDYPALTAFGASGGAQKMSQVTPRISAASSAWADRLLVRHGERFAALRNQAIAEYKRRKVAGQ